jgi:hypothetical protein
MPARKENINPARVDFMMSALVEGRYPRTRVEG